jgi:hypothetical protein
MNPAAGIRIDKTDACSKAERFWLGHSSNRMQQDRHSG